MYMLRHSDEPDSVFILEARFAEILLETAHDADLMQDASQQFDLPLAVHRDKDGKLTASLYSLDKAKMKRSTTFSRFGDDMRTGNAAQYVGPFKRAIEGSIRTAMTSIIMSMRLNGLTLLFYKGGVVALYQDREKEKATRIALLRTEGARSHPEESKCDKFNKIAMRCYRAIHEKLQGAPRYKDDEHAPIDQLEKAAAAHLTKADKKTLADEEEDIEAMMSEDYRTDDDEFAAPLPAGPAPTRWAESDDDGDNKRSSELSTEPSNKTSEPEEVPATFDIDSDECPF